MAFSVTGLLGDCPVSDLHHLAVPTDSAEIILKILSPESYPELAYSYLFCLSAPPMNLILHVLCHVTRLKSDYQNCFILS